MQHPALRANIHGFFGLGDAIFRVIIELNYGVMHLHALAVTLHTKTTVVQVRKRGAINGYALARFKPRWWGSESLRAGGVTSLELAQVIVKVKHV